jgi:HEAT repeat protein
MDPRHEASSIEARARRVVERLVAIRAAIEDAEDELVDVDAHEEAYAGQADLLVALGPATEPALRAILQEGDTAHRRESARALGRLGAPESDASGARAANELLRATLDDAERAVRVAAADALAARCPRWVVDCVDDVEARSSLRPEVRRRFVDALAASDDPRASAGLADLALDADPFVRMAALKALAARLDGRGALAREVIGPRLRCEGDPEGRATLAHLLAQHGASVARDVGALVRDASIGVAMTAARALARSIAIDGVAALAAAMASPHPQVREAALDEVAHHLPSDRGLREALVPLVVRGLGDASIAVAVAAGRVARALVVDAIVAEPLADAIVATLTHTGATLSEFDELRLLRRALGPRAAPAAVGLLGAHPLARVRVDAARLLGELCASARDTPPSQGLVAVVVAPLRAALRDREVAVRSAAAHALARARSHDAIAPLVAELETADRSIRDDVPNSSRDDDRALTAELAQCYALASLGHTGAPEVYARLAEHAARGLDAPLDRDGELARAAYYRALGALEGLAHLRDPRGGPILARALAHRDFRLRRDALGLVVALHGAADRAVIAPLLDDPHPQVRAEARRALDAASAALPWGR